MYMYIHLSYNVVLQDQHEQETATRGPILVQPAKPRTSYTEAPADLTPGQVSL